MGSGSSGYKIGGGGDGASRPSGCSDAGFKGATATWHTLEDNLEDLKGGYEYCGGYFGTPSAPKKSRIRHIEGDCPISTARDFYNRATQGGVEEPLSNGKGFRTTMADGAVVTIRVMSSSDGSPAVDINISNGGDDGIKKQKIHFVKKGE